MYTHSSLCSDVTIEQKVLTCYDASININHREYYHKWWGALPGYLATAMWNDYTTFVPMCCMADVLPQRGCSVIPCMPLDRTAVNQTKQDFNV